MKKRTNTFSGKVKVCCHTVEFFYELEKNQLLNDDDKEQLITEAEERAKEMIVNDYREGELHTTLYHDKEDDIDCSGWWNIKK